MKIFFVAILMAVAAVAQIPVWVPWDQGTFTWDTPEVTLEDLARSYVRNGSQFTSMTDAEKSEARDQLFNDYMRAFRDDLVHGATARDLHIKLKEKIFQLYMDSDDEVMKALAFNSISPAFWEYVTIEDVEMRIEVKTIHVLEKTETPKQSRRRQGQSRRRQEHQHAEL